MAVPKLLRRSRQDELDRIWRQHTDATGCQDLRTIERDWRVYLEGHPNLLDAAGEAHRDVMARDESLRPRAWPNQLSMFDPEAIIPIANHIRRRMADANAADLIMWGVIDRKAFIATEAALLAKDQYRAERLAAFKPHHTRLEDVERDAFAWTPVAPPTP